MRYAEHSTMRAAAKTSRLGLAPSPMRSTGGTQTQPAGSMLSASVTRAEALVLRFLRGLHLAPLSRVEGERAGRWRRDFARRGITLSQADCLIAAAAMAVGARLATGNPKHFPMPELEVEHWPVGA
jgi:predicted nucleic acid-binding protein